jgi:hypothetical protein|tara:strand:+ start:127 stop:807 length:681 start_codon:yes stop_codon:yes gene_type:complete
LINDEDVAELVAVMNSTQTQLVTSPVSSVAIETATVNSATVIEGKKSTETMIDSPSDEFETGAVKSAPETIAAKGLEVDLSLESSFGVVDDSTYSSTGEADGALTSSVSSSDPQEESGGAKTGEAADSTANADLGEASAAEPESGELEGGTTDSVASSPTAASTPSSVTRVTSVQAAANLAKSDEVTTSRTIRDLNLADLADRLTPTMAQLQEGMQQAVQHFGERR